MGENDLDRSADPRNQPAAVARGRPVFSRAGNIPANNGTITLAIPYQTTEKRRSITKE